MDAFAELLKPNVFDKWNYDPNLELSFWDFAGQLEYSAAHNFFLSARQAVYITVFSVLDDSESIMQQLLHWLSVVPDLLSNNHVRLMIVGTKIDLVPPAMLKVVLDDMRGIVRLVVETKGLLPEHFDLLFVSALNTFNHSPMNMSWKSCRRALKHRMYENCVNIFAVDDSRQKEGLLFPKEYRQLSFLVQKLKNWLLNKQKRRLPCCRIDEEEVARILGSVLEEKWTFGSKQSPAQFLKSNLIKDALDVLHDLGIIILYGDPQLQSICLEPQFLSGIMSLLVDPKASLPPVTTVEALMDLMERNPDDSRISIDSTSEEKVQLLMLLESVGLVRHHGQQILVPLALKGRPVCWSEIIHTGERTLLYGQRLGISPSAVVSVSAFLKVMMSKCSDAERMWGCAFAFDVDASGSNRGEKGRIFVRLREDRRSVDVVAAMEKSENTLAIVKSEVDTISSLLGKGFDGPNDRMQLCPMCCSADAFVRSGLVHAFHMREVVDGGLLQCSRYHDVTVADVLRGKLTILDNGVMPLFYPSRLHELPLPWKQVVEGGIISSGATAHISPPNNEVVDQLASDPPSDDLGTTSGHSSSVDAALFHHTCEVAVTNGPAFEVFPSPHSETSASPVIDDKFHDGTFTDVSFFVLTGQVSVGDTIIAADVPEFMRFLRACASQDCSCIITLSNGERKLLHFSYNVGQTIPNPFTQGLPIDSIFPSRIGDEAQQAHAPRLQRFCAHDSVLVVFDPIGSKPEPKFLVFPGSSANLQLCRLTPTLIRIDPVAACCWSELQVCLAAVVALIVPFLQLL